MLDGAGLAQLRVARLAARAATVARRRGRPPCLALLAFGDAGGETPWVARKLAACRAVGVEVRTRVLPTTCDTAEARRGLDALVGAGTAAVDGVFVQVPFPPGVDGDSFVGGIPPAADLDVMGPRAVARFLSDPEAEPPLTVSAALALLDAYEVPVAGLAGVVVGLESDFHRMFREALVRRGARMAPLVDPDADELARAVREAELVVLSAGRAGIVRADALAPGAIVVDAGYFNAGGRGDLDADPGVDHLGALASVPGGVGPMTVSILIERVIERAEASPGRAPPVEVRPLVTFEDYQACLALQRATWGEHFSELVPLALLKVGQRIGGVTAGAFDERGAMLGFVFGLTGVEGGRLVHWSDMLAVRQDMRNQGIGSRLKAFQRAAVRDLGVEVIYWTFDPLVARNAHLNLNRLGVRVKEYVPDMYGSTDSPLHRGLGTDRFVVAWPTAPATDRTDAADSADTSHAAARPHALPDVPVVNPGPTGGDLDLGPARSGAAAVLVRIPPDIEAVQQASLEDAAAWRAGTRGAFLALAELGYEVTGFGRTASGAGCGYLLTRPSTASNQTAPDDEGET
jgi:predicted GNAT superfamily acetyltransferase/5,10-methylene-tetrahydrofolate dehydrogenase/methenyl tetrahydrofolate cyclohydrolase